LGRFYAGVLPRNGVGWDVLCFLGLNRLYASPDYVFWCVFHICVLQNMYIPNSWKMWVVNPNSRFWYSNLFILFKYWRYKYELSITNIFQAQTFWIGRLVEYDNFCKILTFYIIFFLVFKYLVVKDVSILCQWTYWFQHESKLSSWEPKKFNWQCFGIYEGFSLCWPQ
jgi:hypothetical protein